MSIWDDALGGIDRMLNPALNWAERNPALAAAAPLALGLGAAGALGGLGGLGAGAAGGMGGGGAAEAGLGLGEAGMAGAQAGGVGALGGLEAGGVGAGAGGVGDLLSVGSTGGAPVEGSASAGLWGDPNEYILGMNAPPGLTGPGTTGAEAGGVFPGMSTGVGGAGAPAGLGASGVAPVTPGVSAGSLDLTSAGATAGGGSTGGATGGTVAQPSILDQILGGAGKQITSNPLGLALGVGGLGYALATSGKASPATQTLKDQSTSLGPQAQELMGKGNEYAGYLASGNLPPGMMEQINKTTEDAKTRAISARVAQGQSGDPTQNTMLAQDLASIDQQAKIMQAQMAEQLLQAGTNLISAGTAITGLQSNLMSQLANLEQNQTKSIGQAIANWAAAMSPGIKLQLPGTQAA